MSPTAPRYDALVDARGLSCPMPLVKARQALMVLPGGATICVLATDPAARRRGIFDPATVDALLADPNATRTRLGSNELWQLALLEMWLQGRGV